MGLSGVSKSSPLTEHPFELLFGLLFFVTGISLTAGAVAPTSINATLPVLVVKAWGVTQLLGGTLMVVGIVLRYVRPVLLVVGLRIERAGLIPLAAALAVHGIVAIAYAGSRAYYTVGLYLAVIIACLARARAVTKFEKTIRDLNSGDRGE